MADTKISALTDGVALAATDRIPVARSPFASGDNRYITGTEIAGFVSEFFDRLTADRDYYIRTDGSDSNTGLANTSGGAWLTLAHAAEVVQDLVPGDNAVIIHIGAGTFDGARFFGPVVNGPDALVSIEGAGVNSTIISNANSFYGIYCARTRVNLMDFTIDSVAFAQAIICSNEGELKLNQFGGNMKFTNTAGQTPIKATANHSWIVASGNIEFASASMNATFGAEGMSLIEIDAAVTLSGNPVFGNGCVRATQNSCLRAPDSTWTGSATGPRFRATQNSYIVSGGSETFFPGSTTGSLSSGGGYE